jgi:GT2 family glycosyltransferase
LSSTYPNIEIIVIDNGSVDGTHEHVSKTYPNVIVVQTGKNLRYGGGNNLGILKSRGQYILLLNPDTIVDHNYVSELFAVESSDPSVAIAAGKILLPDGRIQTAGATVNQQGYSILYGFGKTDKGSFDKQREVGYVLGAAAMMTRSALAKVGLLDPIYTFYYEETDWCWRARRRGMKVMYVPGAIVYHFGGEVPGKTPSMSTAVMSQTSRISFVFRNFTGREVIYWLGREIRELRLETRKLRKNRVRPPKSIKSQSLRILLIAYWNNFRILPQILVWRFKERDKL